ncbi:MAG: DUF5110 domain-containing protein, partial [Candidatus Binatia bacterium]
VYADATPSQFTVYEDDGVTTAYQQGAVRTTVISQQRSGATILVRIEPASGTYDGAAASRDNIVQVTARDATAVGVSLNGAALPRQSADVQPDASTSGWTVADGTIIATSGPRDVHTRTVFEITLQAP